MLIFWEKASKIFCRFLYKFIIGYYFGQVLLPVVGRIALQHGGISWALVGYMYVYSMYLFFDFAGYSLFAVGTSYMMGYQTPINFNKPFYHGISKNSGIVGI